MNISVCDNRSIDREIVIDLLNLYFSDKSISYEIYQHEDGMNLFYEIKDGHFYDVIFLDVYMDKLLGIDIARDLRRISYDGKIVFLSNSPDYAVDSYDVMASGYLLNPYSYEKLCMFMDRIIKEYDNDIYQIKSRSSIIRIPHNEILFVESSNSKCILHHKGGNNYTIYKKLSQIESELNDHRFLRSHQSYLVNMDYIQQADNQFTLYNGDTVMIRQRGLKDIRKTFLDYTQRKIKYANKVKGMNI